ncbi:hypothetical protein DKM44_03875 [Deinococcus irradiatisoli]|uniref:Uncharacterized protein n=1 Tax=Deinococcus irradiatisoli TaxID=2202254 RepID=A0A2Z3JG69_9DEIO|nr:hypothetical protein [Deinococcus irradiatisoli]AWN22481.1 hypothetical protein DKM44_03875 [Deinococcus irradiatisoli]
MKLTLAAITGVVALLLAAISLPPDTCRAQVQPLDRSAPLNQVLIRVYVPTTCPLTGTAVVRYRTAQGGVLPMIGYYRLHGSYPRERRFWLTATTPDGGAAMVEQKFSGVWHPIWRYGQ